MPDAAVRSDVLIVLVEVPQPRRPGADERDRSETSDQSSFLICAHSSAERRAVLIGLASQPTAASSRCCCAPAGGPLRRSSRRAPAERARRSEVDQLLHGFDQRRQRGFGIAGDDEIRFHVAAEILIVRFVIQIDGGNGDDLRSGLRERLRLHAEPVERRHLVGHAPEVLDFETQNHVGIGNVAASAADAGIAVQADARDGKFMRMR